jgi:hypothetical protein
MADEKKKADRRGGRRKGAGRKPNYLKRLGIPPISAAHILAHVDETKLILSLLDDKSAEVRLRTWVCLREMRDGKPRQAVGVYGAPVDSIAERLREGLAKKDSDIDARIKQLEAELGYTPKPKTIEGEVPANPAAQKIVNSLKALVEPPKAPPSVPQDAPPTLPAWQGITESVPPPQAGTSAYCDTHGRFTQARSTDLCPECKAKWDEDNKKDAARFRTLMPGEPLWQRR